jgi:hypothetical protein
MAPKKNKFSVLEGMNDPSEDLEKPEPKSAFSPESMFKANKKLGVKSSFKGIDDSYHT